MPERKRAFPYEVFPKGYNEFYREGQLQFDRERGEKLNNKKIRATRVSGLSYKDCLAMDLFICFTEKVNCSPIYQHKMEGSYTYTSSEGYDEFLGKRGVPWIVRKMILAAPVELQVSLSIHNIL